MYQKIPADIKPTKILAKISYANAFDADFYLLLRERRSPSLYSMQDAALEVESNISAAETLRGKSDRRRVKEDTPDSCAYSKPSKNY